MTHGHTTPGIPAEGEMSAISAMGGMLVGEISVVGGTLAAVLVGYRAVLVGYRARRMAHFKHLLSASL